MLDPSALKSSANPDYLRKLFKNGTYSTLKMGCE